METVEDRVCGGCERALPVGAFGNLKSGPGGKNHRCKTCVRDRGRRLTRHYIEINELRDPYENPALKCCPKCRKDLPRSEFSPAKSRADGLYSFCRPCAQIRALASRRSIETRNKDVDPYAVQDTKVCAACLEVKDITEFTRMRSHTSGLRSACRACWFERKYKISYQSAMDLFEQQGRACAICREDLSARRSDRHFDHCHVTGKGRNWLCTGCNTSLGRIEQEKIGALVSYLIRHESPYLPKMAESLQT